MGLGTIPQEGARNGQPCVHRRRLTGNWWRLERGHDGSSAARSTPGRRADTLSIGCPVLISVNVPLLVGREAEWGRKRSEHGVPR